MQLEIVTLIKPPLDSVPHLMRPVRPTFSPSPYFLKVPSSTAPSTYEPVTQQLVMVRFLVGRAYPSAKLDFGHIPSSHGELTVQFETRTFWQQSISMPS